MHPFPPGRRRRASRTADAPPADPSLSSPFPRLLLLFVCFGLLAATILLLFSLPAAGFSRVGILALFLIAALDSLLLIIAVERQIRAEAALRRCAARRQALLSGNPDLTFLVGQDGVVSKSRIPAGFEGIVKPGGMDGRALQDALPPGLAVSVQLTVDSVLQQGGDLAVDSGVEADGRKRHLEIRAFPAPGGEALVIARDVTARKAKELELETAYTFLHGYRRALDGSSIVIKLSPDYAIRYVNERFSALSGFGPEEFLGRRLPSVSPDGFHDRLMEEIERSQRDERIWNGIVECVRKGGERFSVDFFILPVVDEFQRILEIVVVGHDVTALKESLEKARAGERAKAEFLANMSHEIRTPLNAIFGFLDLLARSRLDAGQREFLSIVQGSARTLLAVINDVLDFSKIEKGKLLLESIPFQPLRELEIAAEFFSAAAREKGIDYAVFIDPRLPASLRGDPLRLKQVVSNLLSNAVKFTAAGGSVALEAAGGPAPDGGFDLRISVRDSGIGIPAEKQQQIFQAFTQADASVTRRFGGTGLGLAISSHLVREMGGTLDLESREGAGSLFHFTVNLPVEDGAPSLAAPPEAASAHLSVVERPASFGVPAAWAGAAVRYGDALGLRPAPGGTGGGEGIRIVSTDGLAAEERDRTVRDAGGAAVIEIADGPPPPGDEGLRVQRIRPPLTATKLVQAVRILLGSEGRPPAAKDPDRVSFSAHALVAEDHPVNRKLIAIMLDELGIGVDLASDGQEALDRFFSRGYDMVFMDVNMPILDGTEVTRTIRRLERERNLPHTPIIALTAFVTAEERRKALDSGMDGFLAKPVAITDLADAVWGILGVRGAPGGGSGAGSVSGPSWDALCGALGVTKEVARRLVRGFLDGAEGEIRDLEGAASRGDAAGLNRSCHKLKGAALSLRLQEVADIAAALETEARAGDVSGAPNAAARLRASVASLLRSMGSAGPIPPRA